MQRGSDGEKKFQPEAQGGNLQEESGDPEASVVIEA